MNNKKNEDLILMTNLKNSFRQNENQEEKN